jgi:hypothetical protein
MKPFSGKGGSSMPSAPDPTPFLSVMSAFTARTRKVEPRSPYTEALTWLALAPAWPEEIVKAGFPGTKGLETGASALAIVSKLEEDGFVDTVPGAPTWDGRWYAMRRGQRASVLTELLTSRGPVYVRAQLTAAARDMRNATGALSLELTSALERWTELGSAGEDQAMAAVLDSAVQQALKKARAGESTACPEALRWIETAQPIAELLGGALEIAVATAKRRLELFHRVTRDELSLRNYLERQGQEEAFASLVSAGSDRDWALHYLGIGGMGKTMLLRHIKTAVAQKYGLVTARIDFDHLSPDYPHRAPGLLLMGLAEELRLSDNPGVDRIFQYFDQTIQSVHEKLEGIYRGASPASTGGIEEGFRRALSYFVEALHRLSERARPVLILDTCEELARLRSDGTLPNNVAKTFEVLEQIHMTLPSVRVVFSGRRPLAKSGFGWEWPDCSLPPRDYLRLHQIRGFSEEESERFLKAYTKNDRHVNPDLWQSILKQSVSVEDAARHSIAWKERAPVEPEGPRHNPYDLDLYAGWACTEESLSRDRLEKAGQHYYVRERIVGRLSYAAVAWLADIVLLGRFDRELLQALTGLPDGEFQNLFDYITGLEWVDLDRNAHREGVWAVESNLRKRLVAYFRAEDRTSWSAARARLQSFLHQLTTTRPWKELAPSYFEAALDVLSDRPALAAEWWSAVEARIAADREWEWGSALTGILLAEEGLAGRAQVPERSEENQHFLRPAILATRAAVLSQLAPKQAGPVWWEVWRNASRHPGPNGADRLKRRGWAGIIAERRWAADQLKQEYLHEIADMLDQLPPADIADPQSLASELAALESVVEVLERVEWAAPIESTSFARIVARFERFPGSKPDLVAFFSLQNKIPISISDLIAFFHSLLGRLRLLEGKWEDAREHAGMANIVSHEGERTARNQSWLDWKRPEELSARIRLHWESMGREAVGTSAAVETKEFNRPIVSLDSDRLLSAFLNEIAWTSVPDVAVSRLIEESLKVAGQEPDCNVHRAFEPCFAVSLLVLADQGQVEEAVAKCLEISGDADLPLDVRQAADRTLLKIAVRMRLFEEGFALQTSLDQSAAPEDVDLRRVSAALTHIEDLYNVLGPLKNLADLQAWVSAHPDLTREESSLFFSALEFGKTSGDEKNTSLVALRSARKRHIAQVAFERGSLLSGFPGWAPNARFLLTAARSRYESVGDVLGELLSLIALGIARAKASDEAGLRQAVGEMEKPYTALKKVNAFLPDWAELSFAPKVVQTVLSGSADPARTLETAKRTWRPWLTRLVACRVRSMEFDKRGPQTRAFEAYLTKRFTADVPPELTEIFAQEKPEKHSHEESPKEKSPVRLSANRIIGVVTNLGGAVFVILAFFIGFRAALRYLYKDLGTAGDIGAFAAFTLLLGALPQLAKSYFNLANWLLRLTIRVRAEAPPPSPDRPYSAPMFSERGVSFRWNFFPTFNFGRHALPSSSEITTQDSYERQAAIIRIAKDRLSRFRWLLRGSFGIILDVDDRIAGAPWEAVLGLADGITKDSPTRLVFRRVNAGREAGSAAGREALRRPVGVLTWTSELTLHGESSVAWTPLIERPGPFRLGLEQPPGSSEFDESHNYASTQESSRVAVLHVIASAVETSAGLRLRTSRRPSSSSPDLKLDHIPRLFPSLRLCILQDFPTREVKRAGSDRDRAAAMRRVSAELFRLGVPSVIVLPPLPEQLGQEALATIARALLKKPRDLTGALLVAVRQIQDLIVGGDGKIEGVDPAFFSDAEAAIERAADVCFYGLSRLNLRISSDPPETDLEESQAGTAAE